MPPVVFFGSTATIPEPVLTTALPKAPVFPVDIAAPVTVPAPQAAEAKPTEAAPPAAPVAEPAPQKIPPCPPGMTPKISNGGPVVCDVSDKPHDGTYKPGPNVDFPL